MQAFPFLFFFVRWAPIRRPCSQAFLAENVFFAVRSAEEKPSKRSYLVELALVE